MSVNKKKAAEYTFGIVLVIALVLLAGRIYLPIWLTGYVNQQIDALDGYGGSVRDIDVALWRGAYSIHDLNIYKDDTGIPVPFVDIKTVELSIEWKALLNGAVVGEVDLYNADLNFATAGGEVQTGEGAGWAHLVDVLTPFDINRLTINQGKVAFKDFSAQPPVDLFIKDINFQVENLKNVEDKSQALPSPMVLTGNSIGGGALSATGDLNALKDVPDFDMNVKLEHAQLPSINNYANSIAGIDFKKGDLSVYIEAAARNGAVTGYIKPVITNIDIVNLKQDSNPFNLLWESLVAVFVTIFENHSKGQLATRIDISGNLNQPDISTWSAIKGIFYNTFSPYRRGTDNLIDFSSVFAKRKELDARAKGQPAEPAHQHVVEQKSFREKQEERSR